MSALTKIDGVPDSDTAKPGMAFFAGTGPRDATCGGCSFRGYTRQSQRGHWNENLKQEVFKSYRVRACQMFKKLTGMDWPPVEDDYSACKYYAPK